MNSKIVLSALLAGLLAACAPKTAETPKPVTSPVTDYTQSIQDWRTERASRLGAEYSWFSVTGLFWLKEGNNAMGSADDAVVRLPAHAAAERVGFLRLSKGIVTVRAEKGSGLKVGEELVTGSPMRVKADADEDGPDIMHVGVLQFYVIKRGKRIGVRLKDPKSPARAAFDKLEYFDIDPAWRVNARLKPYAQPKEVAVATIIETTEKMQVPGTLVFDLMGTTYEIEPFQDPGDESLFIVFRDATAGKQTYGLGRFVYAPIAKDGSVVLDFNKAYNPPCAFTDYATCPLPQPSNILQVPVTAGEKAFAGTRVVGQTARVRP